MIKSFRHAGIERFVKTGRKAGIRPHHAAKLRLQLALLDAAKAPADMGVPSWRLHQLKGNEARYGIWVNGNYRLTFAFEGEDAILVDYRDYR